MARVGSTSSYCFGDRGLLNTNINTGTGSDSDPSDHSGSTDLDTGRHNS